MNKVGKGLKTGFQKVGTFVKAAAPVVSRVARTVGSLLSNMPGKAGIIGNAIQAVTAGGDSIIDALPKSEFKDKAAHYFGTDITKLPGYKPGASIGDDSIPETRPRN